ncbi:MAG: PACE efflux transporter [Rubrivivax sp.]|nr:PACE efflux transporter [Rubrivivax sp.]
MGTATIRSLRERIVQTLAFEAGGLLLITPLYGWMAGAQLGESLALLVVVSVVVMAWSAFFNTVFDIVEQRLTGRVASERPARWRTVHALAHEASAVLASCPVIYALTPFDWWGALWADLGLTAAYAAYAFLFHLAFDRWRPVRQVT